MSEQAQNLVISVCMAAYNGGQFISEQILSILSQLRQADELIIVDDGSTDDTAEIIKSFLDKRIRLFRNTSNLGVSQTFERALLQARGEIIFLSDQDDIWEPGKVKMVLEAFCTHPGISLVVSDASLVDREGAPLANSYYEHRGRFSDGLFANLIRCKYLGCTMAFRVATLRRALPFPGLKLVLHDIWIGTVNRLLGGKTLYLAEPLVRYRRHDAAATGIRKLSFMRQVQGRAHLVGAAARFWLREYFGSRIAKY